MAALYASGYAMHALDTPPFLPHHFFLQVGDTFEVWTSDMATEIPNEYKETTSTPPPLPVDTRGTLRGNFTQLVDIRVDYLHNCTLAKFTVPEGAQAGDSLEMHNEDGALYAIVPNGVPVSVPRGQTEWLPSIPAFDSYNYHHYLLT